MMYRPLRFSEITGQNMIVRLIKSALIANKLPQTMILHGPSGVGKTTIARLIAAWFVCEQRIGQVVDVGSDIDVCGVCSMCLSVQKDALVDVLEFDAASNTSVDDMREILRQCDYAPQYSDQKIFIIDEAHMLSRNAISALLKILEETASHIRFILLTTEIEKIPNPIKSRCLSLQMQSIGDEDMKKHLMQLSDAQRGIVIDGDAADLIVKLSSGSMRAALSLVEQMRLLDNHVTQARIYEVMSFCEKAQVEIFANYIESGEFVKIYEALQNVSFSISMCLIQLIHCFQNKIEKADVVNKKSLLKILIDLNKLQAISSKHAFFAQVIVIGLTEIAYSNCNEY